MRHKSDSRVGSTGWFPCSGTRTHRHSGPPVEGSRRVCRLNRRHGRRQRPHPRAQRGGAHPRERSLRWFARSSTARSVPVHRRALATGRRRSSSWPRRIRRIRALDNPQRTTLRAEHGLRRRRAGATLARMDGHRPRIRRATSPSVQRLERGDVGLGRRASGPARGRRLVARVEMALETGLASIGSKRWATAGRTQGRGRARHRRLHGSDGGERPARARGLARRLADQPGLGAARRGFSRPAADRAAAVDGRRLRAAQLASQPRAPVLPLRAATGGRRRSTIRIRCVARISSGLGCARRGPARWSGRGRCGVRPGRRSAPTGSRSPPPRRVPALASPDRAVDAATLPLVFATMHGSWGADFVVSTFRDGPPVGALMRAAGLSARPMRSTTKTSVSSGPITPPAPRLP